MYVPVHLWNMVLVTLAVVAFAAGNVLILVYGERKISADFQSRIGPNRVGPFGTLQLIADMLKLMRKEDLIPKDADRPLFILAPYLTVIAALLGWIVVPFSAGWIARDLNVGVLYFLALPALGGIGVIMAGWGSGSKFSVLGGFRSAAQLISYEIPRALAAVTVVMWAGSMSTGAIVNSQAGGRWLFWIMPIAFIVFFIASLAEINRTPFDIPEAESELVSGYHTEYSGMRFMMFMMAEYIAMLAACAMTTTLFLGGWRGPGPDSIGVVWFLAKTYFLVFIMMWLRWTLPRFRSDQLMRFSWKFLLPVALGNLAVYGVAILLLQKPA